LTTQDILKQDRDRWAVESALRDSHNAPAKRGA
jgi:hypothetical protein